MTDKPFQANDVVQVKKRQDKDKLKREQQDKDLHELLALPAFRRYLWRHMNESCGLLRSPFSPNGSTHTMNTGMQEAARIIWVELERIDPKVIPKMMSEYLEAQQ